MLGILLPVGVVEADGETEDDGDKPVVHREHLELNGLRPQRLAQGDEHYGGGKGQCKHVENREAILSPLVK